MERRRERDTQREGGRETQVEEQSPQGDEGVRAGGKHSGAERVKEGEREREV